MMRKKIQYFLYGAMMVTTVNAFANDCVNCGPKDVSGMPKNSTFDTMEKIAGKGKMSAHDRLYAIKEFCIKFSLIRQQMVGVAIKEMEATPITPEEYFTEPVCQPDGYSDAVQSPIIHVVADDISKREEFLQNIWLYYSKKRKQPEIFDKAINAKNTKGETLLDYLETMRLKNQYPYPEQQQQLKKVITMLCTHKGVYATYKDKKCL